MNSNLVADTIESALKTQFERVYRNRPPVNPTYPYIIFNAESIMDTIPSDDYTVYVNIVENPNVVTRAIETLADTIDTYINGRIINTTAINIRFERSLRQLIPANDLVNAQMIQLQYVSRVYIK